MRVTGVQTCALPMKVQRKPGAIFLPHKGMGIDFGGFVKEFAVDHLIRIAHQNGIADVLVDLGQDLFALGGNGLHPFSQR